jgi:hypothetical protein
VVPSPDPDAAPSSPSPDPAAPVAPSSFAPTTDSQPDTAPATQESASAPAPCISDELNTYTYDPATNTGVFTIPEVPGSSGELCEPIWITAVAWDYTHGNTWPQVKYQENAVNGGQAISKSGTYEFGATPRCGQGDVYATWWPPSAIPTTMNGPHDPVEEYFLGDLTVYHRASGPLITYGTTSLDCYMPSASYSVSDCTVTGSTPSEAAAIVLDNTKSALAANFTVYGAPQTITRTVPAGQSVSVDVPRVGSSAATFTVYANGDFLKAIAIPPVDDGCDVIPGDPSVTPAACTEAGAVNGTIFVDQKPGILNYTVTFPDGHSETVTAASISVPAGTYTVNVTAEAGYQIAGPRSWPLQVIVGPATDCGQLPTDAELPTSVTSTGATCSTGTGSITVGPTSDYLEFIDYFIDGKKVTQPTTAVKAGAHVVTAAVNQTTAPGDTLDNAGPWAITISAASVACGQLKTLALTGTSPTAPLLAAGILLPAGAALLLGAALIRRRREQ